MNSVDPNNMKTQLMEENVSQEAEQPSCCTNWFKVPTSDAPWTHKLRCTILYLFIGQVLACLLSGTGIFATFMEKNGISLPFAQNLPHYTLLGLIFGSINLGMCVRRRYCTSSVNDRSEEKKNHAISNGYWPVVARWVCGIVDLHAFWAILAAYGYTNLASIQLLDCLSIPVSMLCSYFMLRMRYTWMHYLGMTICLTGSVLMVVADVLSANSDRSSIPLNITSIAVIHFESNTVKVVVGDVLAIIGATLYGFSTVLQEYVTIHYGPSTYLGSLGITAAPICAIYCLILERKALTKLLYDPRAIGSASKGDILLYYIGYSCCAFFLDGIMGYTIIMLSAVFINLSLLTADFYSLFAGIYLFHLEFHYLYFISFAMIIVGVILFVIQKANMETKVV